MRRAVVEFLITEHPPLVSKSLEWHYEAIRRRIESLAGAPLRSRRYNDQSGFGDAAALVLSGSFGPWEAHEPAALARLGDRVMAFDGPVLGICAGMQLQTMFAGGTIGSRKQLTVGFAPIEVVDDDGLLEGLGPTAVAYEHHAHDVSALPEGFAVLARSPSCAVEAIAAPERRWWGTQFHPEEFSPQHPDGARVLQNFFKLAGLADVAGG